MTRIMAVHSENGGVNTDTIAVVFVGIIAVIALGAIANSVESPQVESTRYEIPGATDRLLIHPTTSDGASPPSTLQVYGVDVSLSGERGWLPPVLGLIVLGLWSLIAMRSMGAPGVVFMVLLGGVLVAAVLHVGQGGPPGDVPPASQRVSLFDQLVLVLVGLITVLSGMALLLPDDADAYTTQVPILETVHAALADLLGWWASGNGTTETPPPENEIYRIWSAFTEQFAPETESAESTARTPGELAAVARQAGAPAEAVRELKRVFELVRYSEANPTDDRAERAIDAWRRIDTRDVTDE